MRQPKMGNPAEELLTVEQYAALPDDDVPTELVRGRVVGKRSRSGRTRAFRCGWGIFSRRKSRPGDLSVD